MTLNGVTSADARYLCGSYLSVVGLHLSVIKNRGWMILMSLVRIRWFLLAFKRSQSRRRPPANPRSRLGALRGTGVKGRHHGVKGLHM